MAAAANQQPLRHEQGDDGADEGEVKSGSPTDSIFDVAAGLDRKVPKSPGRAAIFAPQISRRMNSLVHGRCSRSVSGRTS